MEQQLTIQEFIAQRKIDVDMLYVDKFWQNISDDKWIYVGDEMLRWIGYNYHDEYRHKIMYLNILTTNFIVEGNFQHLTATEFKNSFLHSGVKIEMPNDFNHHNRAMHIVVSPDCFKESLMMMNTDRAKQIRKYYIQLEKIYKAYLKYCHDITTAGLKAELEQAKESSNYFKMMILKKAEYKIDQHIYVASSRNYAKKNIFKVGMTKHLENRMTGYQTGRCADDKFMYLYIIKCVDAKALEQMILSRLDSFRYEDSKELVQIHFETLVSILSAFAEFETISTSKFNTMLSNYYDTYTTMPIGEFDDMIIDDIDLYLEDKFDIKPIDRYEPEIETKPHPLSLTTEEVNTRLVPFGIRLKGEYNGRVDAHDTFECMSVLNHTIRNTYDEIWRHRDKGCFYCRKIGILDQIPIYVYSETYDYVREYATFADLKSAEPQLDHQVLRNIIREERWLTSHQEHIYSILSPHENKLNMMKPPTEAEQYIISKLEIDYVAMRTRTMASVLNFIIAIDEKNGIVYSGRSATKFSEKLTQIGSTKCINRKTLGKYLNISKPYGGYKWIQSMTRLYNGQPTIDIMTLPDLA